MAATNKREAMSERELIESIDRRTEAIQKTLTRDVVPLVNRHDSDIEHGKEDIRTLQDDVKALKDPVSGAVGRTDCAAIHGRKWWQAKLTSLVLQVVIPLAAVILTAFVTVKWIVPVQVEASIRAALETSAEASQTQGGTRGKP